MTYVRASNYKLIDRSARYVQSLLLKDNLQINEEKVIERIFELKDDCGMDRPIVLEVYNSIKLEFEGESNKA